MEKQGIGKAWMLFAGLYITVIAALWTYYKVQKPSETKK